MSVMSRRVLPLIFFIMGKYYAENTHDIVFGTLQGAIVLLTQAVFGPARPSMW
jgi:hypothetical protein